MNKYIMRKIYTEKIRTMENADVKIGIDVETGWIRSCIFKKNDVDLFKQLRQNIPGYIGGIRVYDEYEKKWFSDLDRNFVISSFRKKGNCISFRKKFKSAPWSIKTDISLENDSFRWTIEAEKERADVPDRSMRVYFMWPLIAGWDIWAPSYNSEFKFDGMSSFEFMHIQTPLVSHREVILPMISHFDKGLDIGFSVLEPLDAKVPASKFQFSNGEKCFNWGSMAKDISNIPVLETVNYYIGLVGKRKMKTEIVMLFHDGDWRPALGKVFNKWRDFFVPRSETIQKYNGVFSCEGIQTADALKRVKDFSIKTLEVHGHFENYGDYYQDGKDSWHSIWAKEAFYDKNKKSMDAFKIQDFFDTHSDAEIDLALEGFKPSDDNLGARIIRHSRREIKEKLAKLAKNGVGCYWYFNYTDGFRPLVELEFQDSLCRNEDGTLLPSGWKMCANMNPDPHFSFGRHMIRCAENILKEYHSLAGFFLDCFRHIDIDFAHDDGITVVNNKAAYSINFSYDEIEETIKTKFLIPKGKATFANKPQSIRTMKWVDGVLLEGDGDISEEKYFWACIAKPLFFMWTSDKKTVSENLRRAVLHGAFPRFFSDKKTSYAGNLAIYRKYLPLCEQFKERVFCFEPDPMRVPKGSRGKLFTIGNDYVASIINDSVDDDSEIMNRKIPHAVFKVARAHDITKVGLMYPGYKRWRFTNFRFDGTFIYVPLKSYKNCAVIKLFVTQETRKKTGALKFKEGIDYCMDPESSFTDLNQI